MKVRSGKLHWPDAVTTAHANVQIWHLRFIPSCSCFALIPKCLRTNMLYSVTASSLCSIQKYLLKKNLTGDSKCTLPCWLCNSKQPQHALQIFADHYGPRHTIPWNTIKQGLLQPQKLYPSQSIFNHTGISSLSFNTSFYETISSEFLVQGNFKHSQISRQHCYWWDLNLQHLAPKASAILIELTCPDIYPCVV